MSGSSRRNRVLKQGRVDLAALVARIRAAFPLLAFERAALNDFGEDHAVVVLDDAWVFRFPRSAEIGVYSARERRLLQALAPVSPVAVPVYDHVAGNGDFGGYRMIAGRELSEALFESLSSEAQGRVLDQLGRFLATLHSLSPDLAVADSHADAGSYVRNYRRRRARLAEALGPDLLARADRFYAAFPAAVASAHAVLTHRDLTEDHMLLSADGERLAGVIDFTDVAAGDPAFDFTFLWAYGDEAPRRVMASYGPTDEGLLTRSHWWFARYRLDQIWWTLNGDRDYDVAEIVGALPELFGSLGV
jgi:aminoglycoside 2''-phosphotransferase